MFSKLIILILRRPIRQTRVLADVTSTIDVILLRETKWDSDDIASDHWRQIVLLEVFPVSSALKLILPFRMSREQGSSVQCGQHSLQGRLTSSH